jgi:hypothetical protein
MKILELCDLEMIQGGTVQAYQVGCGLLGLAAGIASGFNPWVGGLTAWGCMLISRP